jgi:hypothetical protein
MLSRANSLRYLELTLRNSIQRYADLKNAKYWSTSIAYVITRSLLTLIILFWAFSHATVFPYSNKKLELAQH